MAKKIKLTDVMADTMRRSFDGYLSGAASSGTVVALMKRGLASAGDRRHKLTEAGRRVHRDLFTDPSRRTWTLEEPAPAEDVDAGRLTLEEAWAEFERDWLRDFRGHVVRVQFPEPDRDAGRLTLEEAQEEAQTAGLMGELSVVRIAYADGTTEECRNIPSGEIAAGIFAEAVSNDRVVKAELVRGDGTVAAQYPSEPMPRARPVVGLCGRHMSESVARAYGWKSLAACARVPGHPGRHRDTRGIAPLTMHWGANETAPLDPTP